MADGKHTAITKVRQVEVFNDFRGLPEGVRRHLDKLEEFVGDVDGKTIATPMQDENGHDAFIDDGTVDADEAVAAINELADQVSAVLAALTALVSAKALSDVRAQVAGWNGEDRPEGPFRERHPRNVGALLHKTNCGAVYDLDAALTAGRAALAQAEGRTP